MLQPQTPEGAIATSNPLAGGASIDAPPPSAAPVETSASVPEFVPGETLTAYSARTRRLGARKGCLRGKRQRDTVAGESGS
jgi:hypothetical protein